MNADTPFLRRLAREAGGALVELAVGNGARRHPGARETGRRVIGIDTSPAMLAQRARPMAGVDLDLRLSDMRDFALDEPAALNLLPIC